MENHYGDSAMGFVRHTIDGQRLTLFACHTVGWSGNEAIMHALMDDKAGALCWRRLLVRVDRGGHYYFDVVSQAPFLRARSNDLPKTRPVARR
jgi:hypothetical protein